ncbi:CIR protein PIR protein, fragment [Plasmodium vinckei vinckei]|uniref:CIR protein PIR protein n=1 Tax=Plasmodium vinckei vinckei TaxID=54757 RepID=A0A449BXC9_PLAVN|nr:CIR protein PIR protein, fragment [Plasmodium vinckei vinckei]VEV58073.1 CIR protein PIR protein, fragment [Plasmodium vinckei vinckei]
MAGWISLLKTIYDSDLVDNDVPKNMNINEYIITWLIYMLKLKDGNSITNLNDFYYQYKNQRGGYSLVSTNGKDYSNIIDNIIINKNYLMDMDKNIIYKFYNLLKSLCSMYNDINKDTPDCTQFRKKLKHLLMNIINFLIIMILILMKTVHIEKYCLVYQLIMIILKNIVIKIAVVVAVFHLFQRQNNTSFCAYL